LEGGIFFLLVWDGVVGERGWGFLKKFNEIFFSIKYFIKINMYFLGMEIFHQKLYI
jgi:hypothetical protein